VKTFLGRSLAWLRETTPVVLKTIVSKEETPQLRDTKSILYYTQLAKNLIFIPASPAFVP
jgi:hypothetical protein